MDEELRYDRQKNAFREARRRNTLLADAGGFTAPQVSRFLKIGAASAGIDMASDFHGHAHPHWAAGYHEQMVRTINQDVRYDYLEAESIGGDLSRCAQLKPNPYLIVHLNDPAAARQALLGVALEGLNLPVLLTLAAPAGVLLSRHDGVYQALDVVKTLTDSPKIPPGSPELCALAAGAALYEVMMGNSVPGGTGAPSLIIFYSHKRPYRVNVEAKEGLAALVREVAEPLQPQPARFTGRRFDVVGSGGLGNFVLPLLALDGGVSLAIYDHDHVSETNLNRQWLFARHVREPKALAISTELQGLVPGTYVPHPFLVRSAADLAGAGDNSVLVAVPDNNEARLTVGDVAREHDTWFATAGTGVTSGQACIVEPHAKGCFRCQGGLGKSKPATPASGPQSCSLVENDAIVATNMIVGAALVAELRLSLSGIPCRNVRFAGNATGNRLGKMAAVRGSTCEHVAAPAAGGAVCRVAAAT